MSEAMTTKIYIKNMVCPRCIMAVEGILKALEIDVLRIELGKITLKNSLPSISREKLSEKLSSVGFELLEQGASILISQIKAIIIESIHHSESPMEGKISAFISSKLNKDYASLSRLFSSVEGITIEKFVTKQKIEKVKELLFYNELTLSEIAYQMNYSSVAHLSAQFKKETGLSATKFKNQRELNRKSLDDLGTKS
ncbi:MAG: AraC-like DNA-binding protein [Cryomorphaceae bacterium]|jgi:AraC-like DNA-binding protein